MIPKILHFTWKSQDLPPQMRAYYDAWRRLHPDWEIRLWTDQTMRALVAEAYPGFLATYDAYPKMIQRADAFRYLVLGQMGGVYADLDVEPFEPIDPFLKHAAFLGIEPLEHIFPDRHHQGIPFLLTNAFMGSVPGHRLWTEIIALMPGLVDQETFYSTGPSMVTAAVLRLAREERPVLLAPGLWSPLLSDGRRTRRDADAVRLLEPVGTVLPTGDGALVSHVWMTTWVPWHKRNSRLVHLLQAPTVAKWALRRLINPHLARIDIRDPLQLYTDQVVVPSPARPPVQVIVRAGSSGLTDDLAAALAGLDYPRDRLTLSVHLPPGTGLAEVEGTLARHGLSGRVEQEAFPSVAARDNALLERVDAGASHVLLVHGDVTAVPRDALQQMLGVGRPVVSANVMDAAGQPADDQLFRYDKGAPFKVLYKDGGRRGQVNRARQFRSYLPQQRAFALLPLDGVGESFVLIDRDVIAAGVRFAETPYKLHLGAEAFGIMARDRGFEVCGLTGLEVIRS